MLPTLARQVADYAPCETLREEVEKALGTLRAMESEAVCSVEDSDVGEARQRTVRRQRWSQQGVLCRIAILGLLPGPL